MGVDEAVAGGTLRLTTGTPTTGTLHLPACNDAVLRSKQRPFFEKKKINCLMYRVRGGDRRGGAVDSQGGRRLPRWRRPGAVCGRGGTGTGRLGAVDLAPFVTFILSHFGYTCSQYLRI